MDDWQNRPACTSHQHPLQSTDIQHYRLNQTKQHSPSDLIVVVAGRNERGTTDVAVDPTSHLSHISANAGLTPTQLLIIRSSSSKVEERGKYIQRPGILYIPLPDHRLRALNDEVIDQEIVRSRNDTNKRSRDQDVTRATTTRNI